MPYKKTYNPKPAYHKPGRKYYYGVRVNRRGIRGKYSWNQLAAGAKLALNVLNSEKKHYDESNSQVPSTSGVVVSIVRGLAQGTTENQMVGNSIRLKRINYNIQAALNPSSSVTRVRWALVLDKRPETSVPSYTTIYSSTLINSFLNIDDQPGRFVVLRQKRMVLSAAALAELQYSGSVPLDLRIRFNDSQIPRENDLLLCILSDEATDTPSIVTGTRLRYYDN